LLLPPIVHMDGDDTPHVWDGHEGRAHHRSLGLPPRESWFANRSRFIGATVTHPQGGGGPVTLEKYLQIAE